MSVSQVIDALGGTVLSSYAENRGRQWWSSGAVGRIPEELSDKGQHTSPRRDTRT